MGPGLNNSAGTTLRPPVTGLKPNSAQHHSGKNVGGSYRVPSLPNSYAGTLGTGAPAVSWNRAPAPQIPQFPHTGFWGSRWDYSYRRSQCGIRQGEPSKAKYYHRELTQLSKTNTTFCNSQATQEHA